MKQCGMEKSWTCMLILSNSSVRRAFLDDLVNFVNPLGCTKHGEALIIEVGFTSGRCGVMVLYDPNDDEPTESANVPPIVILLVLSRMNKVW